MEKVQLHPQNHHLGPPPLRGPGKTEQEACDKLAQLIASLQRGEQTAESLTVDQWFTQWRDTYKAPSGLTPKSLGLYDEKYRGYIGPAVGQLKLGRSGTWTSRPS